MAGFQKKNWGNQNKQVQQQPSAFRDGSKKQLGVKFGRYNDNGNLVVKMTFFTYSDMPKLNKKYNGVFVMMQKPGQTPVYIVVKPDQIDNFKQALPSIAQDLKAMNYDEDAVDRFEEKLDSIINETPTLADIKTQNDVVVKNWKELFKELTNPETRKKFLAFQTSYICMDEYADAMLSPSNVMEIMLRDPAATFVTDARTWLQRFNRRVNPQAQFVVFTKPEQFIPSKVLMEKDPVVRQHGGWDALCKECGGPWYGIAYAAIKRVKKVNHLPTNFYKAKGYDVRFTTPIDPNNDKFMTVANLVNNLTGELNMVAKQLATQKAIDKGETKPDFDTKKEGIETPEELLKFKDYILSKCAKAKITVVDVGSTEDVIANAIYAYAFEKAKAFNTLGNQGRACFASAVLYAIAYTYNINSNKVSSAVNTLQHMPSEEEEEVYKQSYECFKSLATFSVNEAAGDITFDEYLNLFKNIDPKAGIKQRFDDINNRMDNLYNE